MHMPPPIHGAAMMGQYIHDSKLINESFECHYINPSLSSSVANVGKVSLGKIVFMIENIINIMRKVREVKPNLCYYTPTADGWGIYRDVLVLSLLKWKKQKIVLHMHNKGVKNFSDKHFFARWAYRRIFKNNHVILLAKELYPDIQQYVSITDVSFCPNGMPVTNQEGFIRTECQNPYTFLFLSNMIEEKGVIDLLKACSLLKKKKADFVCNFVGRWSTVSSEQFNLLVEELGLTDNVRYLGPKYGMDKVLALKQADALVFPSYYHGETFGLVLLEGMEYGMPCISTFEGGIPSVVDDTKTGFLVQARDIKSLAAKMRWLMENPQEGLKMGELGKEKFLNEFTLTNFERALFGILKAELQQS